MGAALTLSTLVLPLHPAKAQCLGVDLGLVCAGLGLPSAFSHPNPYYYGYPYPGYPPATVAPAPVPQYGSTVAPFTPPSASSPLAIWQPGQWTWTGTGYDWTPGHYVMRPSQTATWVPG